MAVLGVKFFEISVSRAPSWLSRFNRRCNRVVQIQFYLAFFDPYLSKYTHIYTRHAFRSVSNTLSRASIHASSRVYITFNDDAALTWLHLITASENFFFYILSKRRKLIHAHSLQLTCTIFLEHVTYVFLVSQPSFLTIHLRYLPQKREHSLVFPVSLYLTEK